MKQKCYWKAVSTMTSVMAVLSCLHRVLLTCKYNSCILLRSLLSRPYHVATLKIEVFPNGESFWKQHTPAGKRSRRCFSSNSEGQKQTVSIVFTRGPLRWISNKIKLFMVHSFFDSDFDEATFLEGAKQAVCTVSALVSQKKYSELVGLVTNEAIENLRDEMNEVKNIETYRITMEDIIQATIHDIGFQYDESEKGKKWLHVLVSYIRRGNEQSRKDFFTKRRNFTFVRIPLPRVTRYSFRKECTLGIEDSWIITKVITLKQGAAAQS